MKALEELSTWGEPHSRLAVLEAVARKEDSDPAEWAEDQGFYIAGSRFRKDATWYLNEPFMALKDPKVISVTCISSVQSGKSVLAQIFAHWFSCERGGDILMYYQTLDDANDTFDTRYADQYKKIKRLKDIKSPDPHKTSKGKVIHKDGTSIYFLSGGNKKKRQARTAKVVICDEVAQYEYEALDEIKKRTTRFDKTSSKHLFVTTPERKFKEKRRIGDDPAPTPAYNEFISGTQEVAGYKCDCGAWSEVSKKNFLWTDPETGKELKDENGIWDFLAVEKAIRFVCTGCGEELYDNPTTRAKMKKGGEYKVMNPKALEVGGRIKRTFRWSIFCASWVPWFNPIKEFLLANEVAKKGDFEPLREVVRKNFAEFWEDMTYQSNRMLVSGDYEGKISEDYKNVWFADEWENTYKKNGVAIRVLSVDVQSESFWFIVREADIHGNSRLRACGNVTGWADIEEWRQRLDITNKLVFVDSSWKGHGSIMNEIYRECYDRQWTALKGEDRESYRWKNGDLRPFSELDYRDGGQGTKAQGKRGARRFFRRFSNPALKDHLHLLMTGSTELYWGVASNVPDTYLKQMESEVKSDVTGRWEAINRDNHLWDCEVMSMIAFYLLGLFGSKSDK